MTNIVERGASRNDAMILIQKERKFIWLYLEFYVNSAEAWNLTSNFAGLKDKGNKKKLLLISFISPAKTASLREGNYKKGGEINVLYPPLPAWNLSRHLILPKDC